MCYADSDSKNAFRKAMIEKCIDGYNKAPPNMQMPMFFEVKYCKCTIDKILEKYSMIELIDAGNYNEKTDNLLKDMENFGKACVLQVLNNEK